MREKVTEQAKAGIGYEEPLISRELKKLIASYKRLVEEIEKNKDVYLGGSYPGMALEDLEDMRLRIRMLQAELSQIADSEQEYFSSETLSRTDIQWAKGWLHRAVMLHDEALKSIERLIFLFKKKKTSGKKASVVSGLLVYRIKQIIAAAVIIGKESKRNYLVHKYFRHPEKLAMTQGELRTGDVLLSYKTRDFISTHLISRMICVIEGCNFSHSAIVSHSTKEKCLWLNASGYRSSLKESPVYAEKGELLFVFRPKLGRQQWTRLYHVIGQWRDKVRSGRYSFSYFKFYYAILSGLLYRAVDAFAGRIVILKNPFKVKYSYFCSELVNTIFLQSGIVLTSKSEYSDLIGPLEISWSPYLEFKGVVDFKKRSAA